MDNADQLKQLLAKNIGAGLQAIGDLVKEHDLDPNRYYVINGQYFDLQRRRIVLTEDEANRQQAALLRAAISYVDLLFTQIEPPAREETRRKTATFRQFSWRDESPIFLESFPDEEAGTSVFSSYDEGTWRAERRHGRYVLSNTVDKLAVRYHHFGIAGKNMADHPLTVEVKIEGPDTFPYPSAGLIFGFDGSTRRYYAFHVNNQQEFVLWRKDTHAYAVVHSGRSTSIQVNRFNKLGVIRREQEIYLFINDTYLQRVEDPVNLKGDAGFLASGSGTFIFDNLAVYRSLR